jgi:hypothetical protein
MSVEQCWNNTSKGKPKELLKNPASLPTYPPKISQEINWYRTLGSAMGSQLEIRQGLLSVIFMYYTVTVQFLFFIHVQLLGCDGF